MPRTSHPLVAIARDLSKALAPLRFAAPITHVYNPLVYAAKPHADFVERYGTGAREILLMGMNPGPFGMAQTGVPFGEIAHVRDWLGVSAPVDRPDPEHPARPISGFDCKRQEVSGARFWGWAKATFGSADRFFARFFVVNYCPLVFMEASGKNFTPDKLPAREREAVYAACDEALRRTARHFSPRWLIGVGTFAEARAREALSGTDIRVGRILHPSPASPAANSDWAGKVMKELAEMGIVL